MFLLVTLFLISCESATSTQQGNELLAKVRKDLGLPMLSEGFNIYAMADCTGPASVFQTLVVSSTTNTRFEQKSGPRHILGIHRPDTAWLYDLVQDTIIEADSATIAFLINHELHATAFYPESRYGLPMSQKDTVYYSEKASMLTFTDIKGGEVRAFYKIETGLPLGFRIENHLGRGERYVDVLFENWQDLNDIRVFTAASFLQGQDVYRYQFTIISMDSLPEKVFIQNKALISP